MLMQKSKADTWLADEAASPERRDETAKLRRGGCATKKHLGASPHKRLLKEAFFALTLPFGFCETSGDFRPLGQGSPQPVSRQNRGSYFTHHILGLTPPAPTVDPTHIPRGKSFLLRPTCARPAGWLAVSHGARRDNYRDPFSAD